MNNEIKKMGLSGKIATFFLKNRELGLLTLIGLFVWGGLSFMLMSKQYNPQITAPAFTVVTEFPGANTREVYELISRPMEDKIREIPEVDTIRSQSIDGGVSMVLVQYDIGQNVEDAKISLTQKLQSHMDEKPLGASDPHIVSVDPDDVPIVVLALTSNHLNLGSLRKVAFDMADEIKLESGVSRVQVHGGESRHLVVSLDMGKVEAYSLSIPKILSVIEDNNIYARLGDLGKNGREQSVIIRGELKAVQDLENIVVIKTLNSEVYLSDVARVAYESDEVESYTLYSDQAEQTHGAVFISFAKHSDENAIVVSKRILERLYEVQQMRPFEGIDISVVRDDGSVAWSETKTLTRNLFVSIGIVSLILVMFLSWRSSLVVFIAIPLTLAVVFGVGNLFDQTINRITLFALILSLGLLVDSAIVVVENIFRYLKKYSQNKNELVIAQAVDEVGPGLIMSTLTTILAFIPMAFVTGMMGPYMGPIPFFVPAALIASLIIALAINPYLVSLLMKNKKSVRVHRQKSYVSRGIVLAQERYGVLLRSLLEDKKKRRRLLAGVFIALLISVSLPIFQVVQFRMLPKADTEQFYIYIDLPEYRSLEHINFITKGIRNIVFQDDQVENVQSFVGQPPVVDFNGLFKGSSQRGGEHQSTIKVNLTHHTSRKDASEEIAFSVRDRLQSFLHEHPDVRVQIIEDPPGPPVDSTFSIKVQGHDEDNLTKIASDIERKALGIAEVVDVDMSISERNREHVYEVDKEMANNSGISVRDIADTMQVALSGKVVGLYHERSGDVFRKPEQEFVLVRAQKDDRDDLQDIEGVSIVNNEGVPVSLGALMREVPAGESPLIYTDGGRRTQYVRAEMGERSVVYAMIDMLSYLVKEYRPAGMKDSNVSWTLFGVTYTDKQTGEEYSIMLDGEWKLTLEVFRDLGLAMGVAILGIYFVLVAQFRSLRVPVLVMGTIPFALIGVLPGFALLGLLKGTYFNATSMIGVIALSGIVVNNAIILLEYLKQLRVQGYDLDSALIQAGKTRLLPIVLTSLTTILGSLTIISDPVWEGLAWSIFWGLSLSGVLTLVLFPILYYEFEKKSWSSK